jgi:acetate kinase
MTETLLVLNAGSSSIKFRLFGVTADDRLELGFRGQMEGIGTRPRLSAKDANGAQLVDESYGPGDVADVAGALDRLDDWLIARLGGTAPMAIGHRVVHGGPDHAAPVQVDDAVLDRLEELVPLAPLHQPNNLARSG